MPDDRESQWNMIREGREQWDEYDEPGISTLFGAGLIRAVRIGMPGIRFVPSRNLIRTRPMRVADGYRALGLGFSAEGSGHANAHVPASSVSSWQLCPRSPLPGTQGRGSSAPQGARVFGGEPPVVDFPSSRSASWQWPPLGSGINEKENLFMVEFW
jgi:hypothetical protein